VSAHALTLVIRKFREFEYPSSLWVWVIVKSVIIRPPIRLPPGIMLTLSLSQNVPATPSLTMSMAAGGSPPTLWSNIGVVVWVLVCCFPPTSLGIVVHYYLPYVAHKTSHFFPAF
jgi:hypothetical protein